MSYSCLVLVDRDGVINRDSDDYIKSPNEWHAIDGSLSALVRLTRAGCKIAVVSNQSGVGRGFFSLAKLYAIHTKMLNELARIGGSLDALAYCPHHPDDLCSCRKPNKGLVTQVYTQLNQTDFTHKYLIGDSYSDVRLSYAVGATPLLVHTGKGKRTQAAHPDLTCLQFADLRAATHHLLAAIVR